MNTLPNIPHFQLNITFNLFCTLFLLLVIIRTVHTCSLLYFVDTIFIFLFFLSTITCVNLNEWGKREREGSFTHEALRLLFAFHCAGMSKDDDDFDIYGDSSNNYEASGVCIE